MHYHLRVVQKPTINEFFYFLLEYLKENHGAKTFEEIFQYLCDATARIDDVNEEAFIDVFKNRLSAQPESKRAVLAFAYVHDFDVITSPPDYFKILHTLLEPEYAHFVWFKLSDRKKVRRAEICINTDMKVFDRFVSNKALFNSCGSMERGLWLKMKTEKI